MSDKPDTTDLVSRLRSACVGYPAARISWPHRLLHAAAGRRVAKTKLPGFTVSTVFLAIGLFETMIFAKDEEHDLHLASWRCATWDEALKQHEAAVLVVKTQPEG